MHPAWEIEDIRYLIFEFLDPRDLVQLAQTCDSLFQVATDRLWRTLTFASAFLRCLPKDCRSRSLHPEDLQRLDLYASKVRSISFDGDDIPIMIRLPRQFWPPNNGRKKRDEDGEDPVELKSWEQLWSEIATIRPSTEFLPNLRTLRIVNVAEDFIMPLVGMTGCNLERIYIRRLHRNRIRAASGKQTVYELLDQMQETSKLEYLFVHDGEPDLVPWKSIAHSPLKHLRLDPRVSAGRYTTTSFKLFPLRPVIVQKSTLEHLTLGLTRDWYTPEIKEIVKQKYLPALQTLWLNLTTLKVEKCSQTCRNADGWTCVDPYLGSHVSLIRRTDCGRRSPTVFLEGLDNPELKLLNIKFPISVTGRMFLEVVNAAQSSCRLEKLEELALAGGGYINFDPEFGKRPEPRIKPTDLRAGLKMFLPLPRLKTLRVSVAPNFLDVLDLDLYASITAGLPCLEKLWLGSREFATSSIYGGTTYYEKTTLRHLAAFCNMLPKIKEVSVGCVDAMAFESNPYIRWACPSVTSLTVARWAGDEYDRDTDCRELLEKSLQAYFPHSDLAANGPSSQMYLFGF